MWLTITKTIWTYRNKVIFEGGQVDEKEIFTVAQLHTWSWTKFCGLKLRGSFVECCLHPIDCLREVI